MERPGWVAAPRPGAPWDPTRGPRVGGPPPWTPLLEAQLKRMSAVGLHWLAQEVAAGRCPAPGPDNFWPPLDLPVHCRRTGAAPGLRGGPLHPGLGLADDNEELSQAQAAEELRDRREAGLELMIESLAKKCAGLEALIDELKDSKAQQERIIDEKERLVSHLEQFNTFALDENEELRRLLSRAYTLQDR